ncbi:hypothetical protein [Rudaea sp.]|uniref:hypothetical protein n=1 Tax=Rudaea sp. TaxID=2136325 RepID=UPI002ED6897B
MNAALVVALLLACAVVLGAVRTWQTPRQRPVRIGLQIVAALLLYFCLFPPSADENFSADELVVVTPGATRTQLAALSSVATLVALPGVDADKAIERVPDLGTALRAHAAARRLRIVGNGLPLRDRDAARGLVAAFDAAPLPRGLVELDVPTSVYAGNVWRVDGRVEAVADGRVELHDPSGAVVATEPLNARGRFALHANAKGEGTAMFTVKVLDRDGTQVDAATVPLSVRSGAPLKILLLAGAPDAELKYLRRWAADAGLALTSRIALSDGVAFTEGMFAADVEAWRAADIAIVDERAWAALDAKRKQVLIAAVRDGLGLLLRATGPLPAPVAADWEGLGFHPRAVDAPAPVALDMTLGLADSGLALSRSALAVEAGDAAPLLRADDGSTLAWSRNFGCGRVALWLLTDSYRLALGGAATAHGTLWSSVLAAVARARGEGDPSLPSSARVDERAVFCGFAAGATVEDELGKRSSLSVDARGCAAFWPEASGWHTLVDGAQRWPFYVRTRGEAVGLSMAESRRATQALVVTPASTTAVGTRGQPLPRWPFFLAWLLAAAALWWLERGAATD